ncbi:PQQ-like beta-propeller repeat protein [Stieleria sp. TO1_6]|uniref:PQQ-binding-like beta-propeller repeat protein n=1 Tax=Stieleria tagensis TaxID=2956795 RepID=UPI00209A90A8|nr:PQQ-binding-like beta-propeller repeat protein [Stieleria tagensis]MCO8121126.1 PQQ-like beta-propeller repeat protein [Stieleria tagensis]
MHPINPLPSTFFTHRNGRRDLFRLTCQFSLAIGLLAALVAPATAEDWYRWRGPRLDGISTETDWTADWADGNPDVAWTCSVGTGFSSIVVQDNHAFTIGHRDEHDTVYCTDVTDGDVVWKFSYPAALDDRDFEGGPTSTPTIDGDHVYVFSRAGNLYCLQTSTGDKLWQVQIADAAEVRLPGWGFSAAPLVVSDQLLLNMGEAGAAVNKHNGELIWSSRDRECGYGGTVLIPGSDPPTAIFASGRAYVGVDLSSGEALWSERWLTSFNCNAADAIVHDGEIFLSSGYNRGAAKFKLVDREPELVWKSKEMKNQLHTCLLYNDHLYGIDGDMEEGARVKCLKWANGEVVWSVDDLRPGGLALAGGRLLLLTEAGELMVAPASPEGWNPIASGKVLDGKCWTAPVLSNGRVYCRSIDGDVACVDCRK